MKLWIVFPKENKKNFWKKVRKAWNQEKNTSADIKGVTERVLVNNYERKIRLGWVEYFDELYNAGRQEESVVNMIVFGV